MPTTGFLPLRTAPDGISGMEFSKMRSSWGRNRTSGLVKDLTVVMVNLIFDPATVWQPMPEHTKPEGVQP